MVTWREMKNCAGVRQLGLWPMAAAGVPPRVHLGEQVLLEPLDRVAVEVVRRLVEEQQLGLVEDRDRDRHPHLPAAGERVDVGVLQVVGEAHLLEHLGREGEGGGGRTSGVSLVCSLCEAPRVRDASVSRAWRRGVRRVLLEEGLDGDPVLAEHLVADVPRLELLREAVDVLRAQPVEQRRLPRAVLADEAVAVAALEADVGLAQQHAPREGEDDVLDVEREVLVAGVGEDRLRHVGQHLLELLDRRDRDGVDGGGVDGDVAPDVRPDPLGAHRDGVAEVLDADDAAQFLLEHRRARGAEVLEHLRREGRRDRLDAVAHHLRQRVDAEHRVEQVAGACRGRARAASTESRRIAPSMRLRRIRRREPSRSFGFATIEASRMSGTSGRCSCRGGGGGAARTARCPTTP